MARPSTAMPDWASNVNYAAPGQPWDGTPTKVAPVAGAILTGHVPGNSAPAAGENWHKNLCGAWVRELASESTTTQGRCTALEGRCTALEARWRVVDSRAASITSSVDVLYSTPTLVLSVNPDFGALGAADLLEVDAGIRAHATGASDVIGVALVTTELAAPGFMATYTMQDVVYYVYDSFSYPRPLTHLMVSRKGFTGVRQWGVVAWVEAGSSGQVTVCGVSSKVWRGNA